MGAEEEINSLKKEVSNLFSKVNEMEKYVNDCLRSVGAIIKKNEIIENDTKRVNASFKELVNSFNEFKTNMDKMKENGLTNNNSSTASVKAEDVMDILDNYFEEGEFDKQIKKIVYGAMREQIMRESPSLKNNKKVNTKSKTLLKVFIGLFVLIATIGFSWKIWLINKSYDILINKNTKIININDKKEYTTTTEIKAEAKIITFNNKKYYEFNYLGNEYRIPFDLVTR